MPSAPPARRFLTELVTAAREQGGSPPTWLLAVAAALIEASGTSVDLSRSRLAAMGDLDAAGALVVPALPADADEALLGQAHEALLDATLRRARGVFYTPPEVATGLVRLALPTDAFPGPGTGRERPVPRVLDPAVGGAAFLLAAARELEGRGWSRDEIVADVLWGIDIDEVAVATTELLLTMWARACGAGTGAPRGHLLVGDALLDVDRPELDGVAFDAVVGNPPFLSQLGAATARTATDAAALRERFGRAAHRYTDGATLFAVAATQLARPGGRVALILPQSVLVSEDGAAAREALLADAHLEHLWVANEAVFAANVRVCAPILRRDLDPAHPDPGTGSVGRSTGRALTAAAPVAVDRATLRAQPTWALLTADLLGVPAVRLREDGPVLGSFCDATAGFRDQYYGLVPFVREATAAEIAAISVTTGAVAVAEQAPTADSTELEEVGGVARLGRGPDPGSGAHLRLAPLVTSGLLAPVDCRWGRTPTRFAKHRWHAPVVDLVALADADPTLAAWTAARLLPKVVVATQTRVLEAAVDASGTWYPSVPTVALTCDPTRLWHAAAVVLAPPISAWAFHRHAGAALSSQAIKLSARQVLLAPLPVDDEAWGCAARTLEGAASSAATGDRAGWLGGLEQFAHEATAAYGLDTATAAAVRSWWFARVRASRGTS